MANYGSGSAPSQFSRLLRQSRIATFDPSIPQVYTAPAAFAARGEWGFKRTLPSASSTVFGSASGTAPYPGALRYLEVSEIDTAEGQTPWKEREKETLFVNKWNEAGVRLLMNKPSPSGTIEVRSGSYGPRPHTTFLALTERYFPSEIPDPIVLSQEQEAKEEAPEKEARLYNNKWREIMKGYAEQGAADPTYKGIDFMGEKSLSKTFGFDADKFTTRPSMMTNYNSLSEKEFERYIEKIRASRSSWKAHFEAKEKSRVLAMIQKRLDKEHKIALGPYEDAENRGATLPLPPAPPAEGEAEAELAQRGDLEMDMLEVSRDLTSTRDAFRILEQQAIKDSTNASDQGLPGVSQPTTIHPHAGLQYSQPDVVYTNMLAEPLPGRVIHEVSTRIDREMRMKNRVADARSVLIGGHVSYLNAAIRSAAPPTIDWSRQDVKKGTALFRITDAYRTNRLELGNGMHRDMIAPRNEIGYVRSNVEVVNLDVDAPRTMNHADVGSAEYVSKKQEDPEKPSRVALGLERRSFPLSSLYSANQNKWSKLSDRQRRLRKEVLDKQQDHDSLAKEETKKMFDNLDSIVGVTGSISISASTSFPLP